MANVAQQPTPVVNLAGCRKAVRDWAKRENCELFVSLSFNRGTTMRAALQALKDFHARVDRKLLGHDWCKRTEARTRYVAVMENVEHNLHIHLLVRLADRKQWWEFSKAAVRAWKRIAPAGDVDVRAASHPAGAASYMLKKTTLDTFDRVRFSGDY